MTGQHLKQIIWQTVAAIPEGQVATYGQIARLSGYPGHARYVGATLRQLPAETSLPWHRGVNARGEIALPAGSPGFEKQVSRLRQESVRVDNGRIRLADFGWDGIASES
jgi:methylated-DNA-protein-cysteine methyltransferase-like protein